VQPAKESEQSGLKAVADLYHLPGWTVFKRFRAHPISEAWLLQHHTPQSYSTYITFDTTGDQPSETICCANTPSNTANAPGC